LKKFFTNTFFLLILFSVITTFMLVARASDIEYINEYEQYTDNGLRFFHYLILFGPIIPASLYIFIDLVFVF